MGKNSREGVLNLLQLITEREKTRVAKELQSFIDTASTSRPRTSSAFKQIHYQELFLLLTYRNVVSNNFKANGNACGDSTFK